MSTTSALRDTEPAPGEKVDDEFIHYDHIGHGSTPAAWALSITIMVGAILAGIGMVTQVWVLVWIAAVFLPVAIILGVVLKAKGYGVEMDANKVLSQHESARDHQGPASMDNSRGDSTDTGRRGSQSRRTESAAH
ncbi:HGxxPAAW family protein [Nesterenkonia lutea]|uniref:Uncharacterized protein n=1 Tax=Nesterenkonia lutea TaxID=272919 RepID=A0ABR9JEK9_9MICC|nr:HGxxPAAW family protein [Nesterenkonia lutea]MBE1524203.1 hypothetical protein [Nesterenkonia lutea]